MYGIFLFFTSVTHTFGKHTELIDQIVRFFCEKQQEICGLIIICYCLSFKFFKKKYGK